MSILGSLISGAVKTGGGVLSGVTSFATTGKYWLIALVVSNALSFGTAAIWFHEKGEDRILTKTINASNAQIASARAEGAKAQSDQAKKDFAAAKLDFDKRAAESARRIASLQAIIANLPILVPHQDLCFITPEAMGTLNDKDLVGSDARE